MIVIIVVLVVISIVIYVTVQPMLDNKDDDVSGGTDGGTNADIDIPGCLHANAFNYNNTATKDNGTCEFLQCAQPGYDNSCTTEQGASGTCSHTTTTPAEYDTLCTTGILPLGIEYTDTFGTITNDLTSLDPLPRALVFTSDSLNAFDGWKTALESFNMGISVKRSASDPPTFEWVNITSPPADYDNTLIVRGESHNPSSIPTENQTTGEVTFLYGAVHKFDHRDARFRPNRNGIHKRLPLPYESPHIRKRYYLILVPTNKPTGQSNWTHTNIGGLWVANNDGSSYAESTVRAEGFTQTSQGHTFKGSSQTIPVIHDATTWNIGGYHSTISGYHGPVYKAHMIDMLNRNTVASMIITIGATASNMSVVCTADNDNGNGNMLGVGATRCRNDDDQLPSTYPCPSEGHWGSITSTCLYPCSLGCPASHPSILRRWGHN